MAPPCPAQGGVLMHAYNRRVDHLNGGVMDTCQCIHDPLPDACSTSANEAVVASGIRTERLRQVAPWAPDRKTQKMALRTRRSFTRGTPRGLFGRNDLMADHSKSVSSWRMIRGSSLGA